MKSIVILCLTGLLFLSVISFGFCGEVFPPADVIMLDLSNLDVNVLKSLQENPEELAGKLIFYAPAGYELNLRVSMGGSVVSSISNEDYIKVKFDKPVYFYAPAEGEPLFSIDGENWGETGELFSGSISFGCGVEKSEEDDTDKATFNLGFEINLREKE